MKHADGFTLVGTMIGMSIAVFMIAAISTFTHRGLREVRKTNILMSMVSLETRVISAMSNENSFATFDIKKALQEGYTANIPPFPLLDINGNSLLVVPRPVLSEASILPGVEFFDRDLSTCSGWSDRDCLFRLEVSLQMVAGATSGIVPGGGPNWIPVGSALEASSPVAVWAFAYRIMLNPTLELRTRPLGTFHGNPLKISDHKFPIPNHYLVIDDEISCEPGGIISGVDSNRGIAKCIYPSDMCPGSNPLAKQVVIQGGQVGISCSGWKKIRCPTNYVIYDFKPPLFDKENSQFAGLGRCVYFGKDSEPLGAHLECPPKYDLVGTNCVIRASEKFRNIVVSGGS